MTPADRFVWTCSSCGRHVPRRVEECRCGQRRQDVTPPDSGGPETRGRSGHTALFLAAGVVLGVGLAAGALWFMRPPPAATDTAAVEPGPDPPSTLPNTSPADVVSGSSSAAVPSEITSGAAVVSGTLAGPPGVDQTSLTLLPLEDVIARTVPAVASIQAGPSRGSGFFIKPNLVLTNAHVVGGQSSVQLQANGVTYTARVTRVSAGSDLAALEVFNPNDRQPSLRLGSLRDVRVGQEVVAIGSALGVLSNTVTRGIVSALRETGSVTLIQTDAAINPGNSGGPLVDRAGVVIGINSMRVSSRGGEGLAFAVAIDHAVQLLSGQALAAAATPLQGLNRLMGAPPTTGGDIREQGTQAYRSALDTAVRGASELDTYWERYAPSCVSRAARAGDRAWFAVYEPDGIRITVAAAYDCQEWLRVLRTRAATLKTEMEQAAERARRQGVYPGVMRDLRRQHRMAWAGWDR